MPLKRVKPSWSADHLSQLADVLYGFRHDPLGFVHFAFPWGEGPLAKETGPSEWQIKSLQSIGQGVSSRGKVQHAVASGKGIGKSAEGAWLILWAICTAPYTRGAVTANTFDQIRTKTWPELAKWYHTLIPPIRDQFILTATSIYSADPSAEKTWRIDAATWSANNVEAFAGLHNKGRRIFVLFDEASAIDDAVWDTTDGIMSDADTEVVWAVRGNPTRNTGRFRECWGRQRHMWVTQRVDSRTVKITDKAALDAQVIAYGEDSDYVRKYIKGEFPSAGTNQFIPHDLVQRAMEREPISFIHEPLIMGVDVARFGDDQTVIAFRRGRDACSIPWVKMRGADIVSVAMKVAELKRQEHVDAIFVDGVGIGAGVVDLLRRNGHQVYDVQAAAAPDRAFTLDKPITLKNKRAEMWAVMREWLQGGALPDDADLESDLIAPEYGFDPQERMILESKDDMRKRGLSSPDAADALALTFAFPVASKADTAMTRIAASQENDASDYNYLYPSRD